MRRLPSWIACCLLLALFVAEAGCGGAGSSSGPPSRFANFYAGSFLHPSVVRATAITGRRLLPYVGSYSGAVVRTDTGSSQPVTLTITSTGVLTGTQNPNTSPTAIVGTVSQEGLASITSTNVFGTYTFPWAASFNTDGNLILVSSDNTGAYTIMTLTKTL